MNSDHVINISIEGTQYSVHVVRRMILNADREVYHLESYRDSSFLARAFVSKLSSLNLCDMLKIPIFKLSYAERRDVLHSVIETALLVTTHDENPDIRDTCEIIWDDQHDKKSFRSDLILYRARLVNYKEVLSLVFAILPGVSDLLFLESLSFPVKRALKTLKKSVSYTFFLSMPYCSLKTTLLNCLSNFASTKALLNHRFNEYANIDALILSSQEHYGMNYIIDDAGNKGLFRASSLDRRREDLDTVITFNADCNERSNIILCAEDHQNLGRLSTYSRLLIVSHNKPDSDQMTHMISILNKIHASSICAFYLDFYNAVQTLTVNEIDQIFMHDDYKSFVKSDETLRIGRHTHILYVVWKLLEITVLKEINSEKNTPQIIRSLQDVVNRQENFEHRMLSTPVDPVCMTHKLIESNYLKKYDDRVAYEKNAGLESACFIDRFETELFIRSEVLWSALRTNYNIPITKNKLNQKLAQAGVIKKDNDGRNVQVVHNKRYLIIDLNELKAYVSISAGYNNAFDQEPE